MAACKDVIRMFEKGCVITLFLTRYKCIRLLNQNTAVFSRLKKDGTPGKRCIHLSRDPMKYFNVPLNIEGLAA